MLASIMKSTYDMLFVLTTWLKLHATPKHTMETTIFIKQIGMSSFIGCKANNAITSLPLVTVRYSAMLRLMLFGFIV